MNVQVKNVTGSSKVSPNPPKGYTSWIEYWKKKGNFNMDNGNLIKCPGCGDLIFPEELEGCHVQKVSSSDKKWYIAPLCNSCNHYDGIFEIDEDFLVDVPSNLNI